MSPMNREPDVPVHIPNRPAQDAVVAAPSDEASFRGFARIIKDTSNIGTRYIAVAVDGEKAPKTARGYVALRGITVTAKGNLELTKIIGDTVCENDYVEVVVRTDDLARDMEDGVGLTGVPQTFRGLAVYPIASQRHAVKMVLPKL